MHRLDRSLYAERLFRQVIELNAFVHCVFVVHVIPLINSARLWGLKNNYRMALNIQDVFS